MTGSASLRATRVEPVTRPDMSLISSVRIDHIRSASDRLAGRAFHTPVHTARTLNARAGCSVFLKCENFQRVGAFKFRGAYNALAQLEPGVGVLTYSSGNHAQAVALAAAELGRMAVIVMPMDAPGIKLSATRHYLSGAQSGSRVEVYDPTVTSREDLGRAFAEREGLTIIPPYDHPHVIAGQGTAAMELFDEVGPLDTLLVPCGGGGLLSGSAVAAGSLSPGCQVVGVEPALADDAIASFRTGHLHSVRHPATIADGARTPSLGRYTFALVTEHVSRMCTVSESEIARATIFAWERLKLVVEPSGVLGLAGLMHAVENGERIGKRVGIILSGGNMDPSAMSAIVELASDPDPP